LKGTLGIAEDPTEASLACRQGPGRSRSPNRSSRRRNVFTDRMSFIFKTLHVVRIVDAKRNTLVFI